MKLKKQPILLLLKCLLILSVPFFTVAKPNDGSKISRTTSRTFRVNPDVNVTLTNKYGKVVVNTWDKPTVKVEANVTAFGKNDEVVQKLLKRVELDFDNSDNYVTINTVLDRKSGFLQDVWNSISDGAKVVFNKNRIQIHYELHVPQMAEMNINNKFGDVILGEMSATCKVRVSNGNLRVESIKQPSRLHVNFGQASIKYMEEGSLTLHAGEADIDAANLLEISSHSSDIEIGTVKELRLDSRNDKVRIKQLDILSGKTTFTKINIDQFNLDISLRINFGYLELREAVSDFSQINIEGRSADITLRFHPDTYLKWSITAKENKFSLPSQVSIDSQSFDSHKKLVSKKGSLGTTKSSVSHLSIYADGGDVNLRIL